MEYALLALVSLIVVPGATLLATVVSGYLVARGLGIPEFRLFRRGAPGTKSKRFFVRAASVVAAFVACLAIGALTAIVTGTKHSTMFVEVHAGPARDAGLRDGDRIVAIDGKPIDDFDALRADIQSSTGPRSVTFERNGERITRDVDPMPKRLIGVSPLPEVRPATAEEAIELGLTIALYPIAYFKATNVDVEVVGAVRLVKEAGRWTPSRLGMVLFSGAIYAAHIWPVLVLLHLFDVALLHFRRDVG